MTILERLRALLRYSQPPPATIVRAPRPPSQIAEYKASHDIRDLATLPCVYGCTDPVGCRWPHVNCNHCQIARWLAAEPDA